jgi:hypothetical protein
MMSGYANVLSLMVGLFLMTADLGVAWFGVFMFVVAIINIASTPTPEKGKNA